MGCWNRSRAAAFLAAASLVSAAGAALAEDGVTQDKIRIGSFGALTGPGYLYGKLVMNGAEVVYNEVNKAGGINGRKIELVREDDRCDAAGAIAAVKKLAFQEKVFMLHGGGCSNATLAARPEIEKAKIPTVIFASVADPITEPMDPNIFTTVLTSGMESWAQLGYALKKGAKKIAVISQRDAWGRARYNPLMDAFKAENVKPVADEELSPDANDATAQVLRLRQAGADAVILVLYPKAASIFARDAFKLGFKPLLIGQTAISDPIALNEQVNMPGALDKFVTIAPVGHTPDEPAMEKWRKLLGEYFPGDRLSTYNLFGIGSALVVVEALKRAGPDLTHESFLKAMAGLKDFQTGVYPGGITCSETDHQCNKTPAWLALDGPQKVKVVDVTPLNIKK